MEKGQKSSFERISELLPDEEHLADFSKIFLESMSYTLIDSFSNDELVNFLKERFYFFRESVKKGGDFDLKLLEEERRLVLDWSYPDAVYSMDSIENILKQMGAKVFRKVFRSIGVKVGDNGKINSIYLPKGKEKRNVQIYIELQPFAQKEMVETLKERLRVNAHAMSQAIKDAPAMISVLKGLIPQIKEKPELVDFINWMEDSFFFMGHRAFEIKKDAPPKDLPETGLGVCAQSFGKEYSQNIIEALSFEVFKNRDILDKFYFGNIRASNPVRKSQGLMRICIRVDHREHNFLGFVRSYALNQSILDVPILKERVKDLFEKLNIVWESYSFNKLLKIISLIPKTDIFKTPQEELTKLAKTLLTINLPGEVHCQFYSNKITGRLSLYVIVPKDRYDLENIDKIIHYLSNKVPNPILEVVEVKGTDPGLLHFHFEAQEGDFSRENISEEISRIVRPWGEELEEQLEEKFGLSTGEKLSIHYLPLFPQHYRDRTTPEDAAIDVSYIEDLAHKSGIQFDLKDFKRPGSKFHNNCSLITIYSQEKIDLIKIMPIMKNLGLYVFDQLVSRIGDAEYTAAYVGSFRVVDSNDKKIDLKLKELLGEMIAEILAGRSEDDYLNTLVLKAHLNHREINILELYRNLYLQTRPTYDRHRITAALSKYPQLSKTFMDYFKEKFSPDDSKGDKDFRLAKTLPKIEEEFLKILADVSSVAEDMIFRNLFTLLQKTVRVNFFVQHKTEETFLSVKILSSEIDFIPHPRPYREIYVHDSNMEGTHLRLGPIARGGLRWSDRGDDFRTEILGLVHTQQKKNVVIVPTGSKGGFFIKRLPANNEEMRKEGVVQYQRFIKSLLEITDNMDVARKVSHPKNVLCYDALDPYLVVAADKGTATFSDIANTISTTKEFWLGDAFASGGSAGYDHKKEAITARGAYECVKIHFLEKGKDIEKEIFTLAGIGDMSGDVFGNGLLLTKKGQLKAAFNHLHIFLDPSPDPDTSLAERKRLFNLPRSSWTDYNTKLISKGGGIFSRAAKTITLTPEVKEMLKTSADQMTGEQLAQAILKMPVELFWFGGIGTYIRSTSESNLDVGDKANDSIRIDATEFGAQVIGEGANLGVTQKARLELSKLGIAINSDAIDNSAGVNMSDYEVNIKILLNQLQNEKKIKDTTERNQILSKATNQVSELVLSNNRGQHRMISMDAIRSKTQFRLFKETIDSLTKKGMSASSENIPKKKELDSVEKSKKGLARPLISTLSAYVKMEVKDAFVKSELLNDSFYDTYFSSYFPQLILDSFGSEIHKHPLRKEIISMVVTNKIVNQAGIHLLHRLAKGHPKTLDQIGHAYLITEKILNGQEFRQKILLSKVPELAKYEALVEFEDLLKLLTHFSLRLSTPLSPDKIPSYAMEIGKLETLLSENKGDFDLGLENWAKKGFDQELSRQLTLYQLLKKGTDLFYFHEEKGVPCHTALKVSLAVNEKFNLWGLFQQVKNADLSNDWENDLKDILIFSLESIKFRIVDLLLLYKGPKEIESLSPMDMIDPMIEEFKISFDSFFETLSKIKEDPNISLTALSVCINGLNFLENALETKRKNK